MRLRPAVCAALLLLMMLLPTTATASGSVELHVATRRFTLTVAQTFRKILARGQSRTYYASVRRNFTRVAGGLVPSLSRFLSGIARRRVHALADNRVDWPVVVCRRRGACPPEKAVFPAILRLAPVLQRTSDRTAYSVALPFRRRPGAGELAWLRAGIQRIVDRDGGKRDAPVFAFVSLKPQLSTVDAIELRLTPRILISASDASWFEGRFRRLLASFVPRVRRELKQSSGLRFQRFDAKLAHYGDSHRLPALISTWNGDARYQISVRVAVRSAADPSQVRSLERALFNTLRR